MIDAKVGDVVTRNLAGALIELEVTAVDDKFIYCGPKGVGWKFDKWTGAEVDEELGWGPPPKISGSFIVLNNAPYGKVMGKIA